MTINIALATSEGLVLGCDSIASAAEYFVNPFGCPREKSADGTLKITITPDDIVQQVTQTWDGVTKMFPLQGGPCPVAAVTAGLAKFCDRTMSSYADEFYAKRGGAQPVEVAQGGVQLSFVSGLTYERVCASVEETAQQFLRFMRGHYERHYADSELPEEYRDGPLFLIGGYGRMDHLPSLYRVNVRRNSIGPAYSAGEFGLAWEGQADAVERLIQGYDSDLRTTLERQITAEIEGVRKAMGEAAAAMLQQVLDRAGTRLSEGINTELPAGPSAILLWDHYRCNIGYGNLPLQDAVDLVSFLVGLQSGKSKFADGVPTVGGRTHIGVITKRHGFKMLAEPELNHTHLTNASAATAQRELADLVEKGCFVLAGRGRSAYYELASGVFKAG